MKNDALEGLKDYAEGVRKADYDYFHIFDSLGHGLEVVFDGVVTWSFDVKVRRPWRLLGIVTDEKYQIFQRDIRTHVVTAEFAKELANPMLDRSLSVSQELSDYNGRLAWPDQVSWPSSIYDWEGEESERIDFQILDFRAENLQSIVASSEDEVLVSRSITGFEGHEAELVSINRLKQAYLDGSAWEDHPKLDSVTLVSEPKIFFNDVELSVADQRNCLKRAAELLP